VFNEPAQDARSPENDERPPVSRGPFLFALGFANRYILFCN
jgi:hypothetical protein